MGAFSLIVVINLLNRPSCDSVHQFRSMGNILGFFQRRSLGEQLEEVENSINAVRKNRYQSQQRQRRLVASVTLWTILLYTICAASFLAFYFPPSWKMRVLYALPLCFGPVLAYILRRMVMMYFSTRLKSSDEVLRSLVEKKKTLLETVREKESYKKAKEILEKYDPEVIKMKNMAEELQRLRSQSANSEVRRRQLPQNASPSAALNATPAYSLPRGAQFPTPQQPQSVAAMQRVPNTAPGSPMITPHRLPARPIPPPSSVRSNSGRSTFDRMMEYIVGDGPGNKFALICSQCLNHNGMALKEEYEYVAFRCAYCGLSNPAKKGRPAAPRIPVPMPPTPVNLPQKPNQSSINPTSTTSAPISEADSKSSLVAKTEHKDSVKEEVAANTESSDSLKSQQEGETGESEKSKNDDVTSNDLTTDDEREDEQDRKADESLEPMETSALIEGRSTDVDMIQEEKESDGEGDESIIADMEILNQEDVDSSEYDGGALQGTLDTTGGHDPPESHHEATGTRDLQSEEALSSEGSVDSVNVNNNNINQLSKSLDPQKRSHSIESKLPDLLQ